MKKFVLLLLLLVPLFTVAQSATPRIIGGGDAPRQAYPWMVALLDANEGNVFQAQNCGGTLVRSDIVLTAAHCVDGVVDLSEIDVVVGAYNLTEVSRTDRIDVIGIIIHPGYDPDTVDNDIALLRLARPSTHPPVSLIDFPTMSGIGEGSILTAIGWGALNNNTPSFYPVTLQQVELPYVSPGLCQSLIRGVTENMLCAGVLSGGKDSCGGDSGGPLLYQHGGGFHQVGIVSWGEACAQPNQPGVYTRMVNYVDWVNQILTSVYVPETINFGVQVVGFQFLVGGVLANWSNETISVQGISDITGSDGLAVTGDVSHTCGVLEPGQECVVIVELDPRVGGRSETVLGVVLSDLSERRITITGGVLGEIDVADVSGESDRLWLSGVDAVWLPADDEGRTTLRSGEVGDGERSRLIAFWDGPGTLVFDWRVSSEAGFDFLDFSIDGESRRRISGIQSWSTQCEALEEGEQILIWEYSKDVDTSQGGDYAAVDNVRVIPEGERSPCDRGVDAGTDSGAGVGFFDGGGGFVQIGWLVLCLIGFALRRQEGRR